LIKNVKKKNVYTKVINIYLDISNLNILIGLKEKYKHPFLSRRISKHPMKHYTFFFKRRKKRTIVVFLFFPK